MHPYLRRALSSFSPKGSLNHPLEAKQYLALCTTLKEPEISQEEIRVAYSLLVYCYLKQRATRNVEQALIYLQLLGDIAFKSKLLPSWCSETSLITLLCKRLANTPLASLDISHCRLHDNAFEKILAAVKQNKSIVRYNISANPIGEQAIHSFLNAIEDKPLQAVNLSHLKIAPSTLQRLAKLIVAQDRHSQRVQKVASSPLLIDLSHTQLSSLESISNALKHATHRAITVSFTQHDAKTQQPYPVTWMSKALLALHAKAAKAQILAKVKSCVEEAKQAGARLTTQLVSGSSTPHNVIFLETAGTKQAFVYDQTGELCAFTYSKGGQVTITYSPQVSKIALSEQFLPCQSLIIHAPGSQLSLDHALTVAGPLAIHCDHLSIERKGALISQTLVVAAKTTVTSRGSMEAKELQVDSPYISLLTHSSTQADRIWLEAEAGLVLETGGLLVGQTAKVQGKAIELNGEWHGEQLSCTGNRVMLKGLIRGSERSHLAMEARGAILDGAIELGTLSLALDQLFIGKRAHITLGSLPALKQSSRLTCTGKFYLLGYWHCRHTLFLQANQGS
jgi:hypothetical protein